MAGPGSAVQRCVAESLRAGEHFASLVEDVPSQSDLLHVWKSARTTDGPAFFQRSSEETCRHTKSSRLVRNLGICPNFYEHTSDLNKAILSGYMQSGPPSL